MVNLKKKRAGFREFIETVIPFNHLLGIQAGSMRKGWVRLVLPFREEFVGDTKRPALHGGVISTLVDMAGGAAAWTELPESDRLSTVDILVDYLRPAGRAALVAEARVVRLGNRVAVVQVMVYQEGKEIIAQGRAVFSILRSRDALAE